MKCPECSMPTYVIDTRAIHEETTVYRRRRCVNGHRFTTHEILMAEMTPEAWQSLRNHARQVEYRRRRERAHH
jgi:transcriptional regulator NrdR family protein